jgi:hypothetical protein
MDDIVPQQMFQKMALMRGYFLNRITVIEKHMEMFIANYFCKTEDQEIELVDWLLGDLLVSFEGKRVVFMKIIEKHYNESFKKDSNTITKLRDVQSTRNKFAHRILNVSDEAIVRFKKDGTVGLVQFVDKKKPEDRLEWYTPQIEKQIMEDIEEVHKWLENMDN